MTSHGPQPESSGKSSQSEQSLEFEKLDRQMRPKLLRLAWVIVKDWSLAADAVQNAFLTLHQKWGEVAPENRLGWLVKTVQYSAHNLRRSHATSARLEDVLSFLASAEGHQEVELDNLLDERIALALMQLPQAQQQVVRMKLVDELTFQQIAEQLSIPLGTALSRMRLALEKLRTVLRVDSDEQ